MDQKTLQIILKVCRRLAPRYTFGYYSVEDIEQESFIFALAALPRYDESISCLENFLHVHVSNKLKTFKRDHYVRNDFTCKYCGRKDPNCEYCKRREWKHLKKKHLMEPIDIDNVNDEHEKSMHTRSNVSEETELDELFSIINQNLDVYLRQDYLKMLEGISIPKSKKQLIEAKILEILSEYNYYDEYSRK